MGEKAAPQVLSCKGLSEDAGGEGGQHRQVLKQASGPPVDPLWMAPAHPTSGPPLDGTSGPNKNTEGMCSDLGNGPRTCATWQRFSPLESWEQGGLLRKKKEQEESEEMIALSFNIRGS